MLPPPVYQLALILHVLFAMIWLSATASIPRRLREALQGDASHTAVLIQSAGKQRNQAPIASGVMLLTGILLALHLGFPKIDVRYHIAMTTTLLLFLADVIPARATIAALLKGTDRSQLDGLRKRMAMITGIEHLLFAVTLVLMLWRL